MRARTALIVLAFTLTLACDLTALETIRGVVRDASDFQCSVGCGTYYIEPDSPYVTTMLGGDFRQYLDQHVQITGFRDICSGCIVLFPSGPVIVLPPLSVVDEGPDGIPREADLRQNFPNPFNPATRIDYDLPAGATVVLKVYTLAGQEVATLVDAYEDAGFKTVEFQADGLASGIYVYRLFAERNGRPFTASKRMLLLR